MSFAKTFLLAVSLAGLLVAAMPTANAAIAACGSIPATGAGPIGRTIDYVDEMQQHACLETFGYAYDMCLYVFAPNICLVIV